MITPAQFKIKFSTFACQSDATVQLFIDEAEIILNEPFWGTKYDLGLYYYTAHLMEIASEAEAGVTGSTGPVASQAVDGTSITYAVTAVENQGDAFYSSTIYGQRYLTLRNSLGVAAESV
jgi:hypothetical protein